MSEAELKALVVRLETLVDRYRTLDEPDPRIGQIEREIIQVRERLERGLKLLDGNGQRPLSDRIVSIEEQLQSLDEDFDELKRSHEQNVQSASSLNWSAAWKIMAAMGAIILGLTAALWQFLAHQHK